jgi:hypothetical protein
MTPQPPSHTRNLPALAISLVCTLLLVCAFVLPVLDSSIDISLPGFLERFKMFVPDNVESSLKDWVLSVTGVPLGDQYIFGIIRDLWRNNQIFLSSLIFFFSVLFPFLKLILTLALSTGMPLSHARRRQFQGFLETTAKWSMADVFIVAMVVVFFKADGFQFEFAPQAGIYCFALAALGSSLAVTLLHRQFLEESQQAGVAVGKMVEKLRERGDAESQALAEELDAIRGPLEKAVLEA